MEYIGKDEIKAHNVNGPRGETYTYIEGWGIVVDSFGDRVNSFLEHKVRTFVKNHLLGGKE